MTAVLRREERDGALWLSLSRPPLNVLDFDLLARLDDALAGLERRHDLHAIVLRSDLQGCFSAGVDVAAHARAQAPAMLHAFHGLLRRIEALPQVSVAAVAGTCLGGGCELAMFCDFVYATPGARFAQPEIDVGCFPPVAALLLPDLIGRAAAECVLTGASLAADEAARLGLVTRLVEDADLAAQACVERLSRRSPAVLALARRALRGERFSERLAQLERLYVEQLLPLADAEEGVRAFLEKRAPRWSGA
jgi:cyclohexa-1,5-dienecarbonyl-CoA hydratase